MSEKAEEVWIKELDRVVLTHDIEEYGLKQGDVGVVMHCYANTVAFVVEFDTPNNGVPVALLDLEPLDIRPIEDGEILHVRKLEKEFKRFIFGKILEWG